MPTHDSKPLSNYQMIWNVVRHIPKGRVATYGEVAEQAGLPGQARLVGYALHNLSPTSNIPWHRVINSQGRISLPEEGGRARRQRLLLARENVRPKDGKYDLLVYGWLREIRRGKR
jgi:methylated-DNA-protein-cysteine methyltransferase-like protein